MKIQKLLAISLLSLSVVNVYAENINLSIAKMMLPTATLEQQQKFANSIEKYSYVQQGLGGHLGNKVPETEKEAKVVVDAHNKENVRKNIEQMKKDMNEVINNSKNKP
jgi:hypothetical protein